jgi:hypothetical protein
MTKADILQEIKRTAAANGGKPLGSRRFQREIGITRYDWCGKYWVNWGDAVREAGFTSNQFAVAYDDEELLDKYVALARELGRLPGIDDLRLKARNDPGFPSEKPFRRLGLKRKLVERLVVYCRSQGYDDMIRLCESYLSRTHAAAEEPETNRQEEHIGYVYLMKSGRFHKIGMTNAAGRREYELAIQLPEQVKTIHVICTDDPAGIEAYWHRRFAAKRKNGEWFALDAADVRAFKLRKFM